MSEREYNEQKYSQLKDEEDNIKNAAICDEIADDSLGWNPSEAVYWRKKAIELAESYYGKENINNTFYYDKIVNDFLEKNSYLQADKWNKKSKKIKIKEKGEYAFEIIKNELFELSINISREKYDQVPACMDHIKEILQKNPGCDSSVLYQIYMELSYAEGDSGVRKIRENDGYYIDRVIDLAREIYGEDSLEVVEGYRQKALGLRYMWQGEKENAEALKIFKKALLMAIKKGASGGYAVMAIIRDITGCWEREVCYQECIKWVYHNISKEFAIDIMESSPEYMRKGMKEGLKTLIDLEKQ